MIFYDTNSLLDLQQDILKSRFVISNTTLTELEQIKSSGTRDEEIKWKARRVLHILSNNEGKYEVIIPSYDDLINLIHKFNLPQNNDSFIIGAAYFYHNQKEPITFISGDLACKQLAVALGIPAQIAAEEAEDDYTGYKEIIMDDDDLVNFYGKVITNKENPYELKINEYLLITDSSNKVIDKYKWTLNGYEKVLFCKAESKMFGKISPKDAYQNIALNSLMSNQITMLRGPAGTGKSLLAFGHMFNLLEQNKISKIIVFCNTVATKGSAKLGFYPGSRTEKLLDSQIGNLLESKIGDRCEVERLIGDGHLILLPMSDIRGYDTTGMNAAIYISEAQNLDIELMRLALQRIGEDSICIIDGDDRTQVDMSLYAGSRNGMRRVSQVFRGQDFYGEVELVNIHRSKIAKLAQEL